MGRDRGSGQGRAEGLVSLQYKYSFESCLDPEGTNLGNKWLYLWVHRDGFGRRGFIIDLLWGGLEGYGSMTECVFTLCVVCSIPVPQEDKKTTHVLTLPQPPCASPLLDLSSFVATMPPVVLSGLLQPADHGLKPWKP